jgi:hypothetical protein
MPDVTAMDIDSDHGFLASAIEVAAKDPSLMDVDRHHEGQPDLPSTVPRAYQQEILEEAYKRNIIAVLPTGVGKTLIGALLIKRTVKDMARMNQKKVSLWQLAVIRNERQGPELTCPRLYSSRYSWCHPSRSCISKVTSSGPKPS